MYNIQGLMTQRIEINSRWNKFCFPQFLYNCNKNKAIKYKNKYFEELYEKTHNI